MERLQSLLPDVVVTVEESEVDDYAPFVPKERLLPHPRLGGLAEIRNWIIDTLPHECLVMVDDDFRGVIPMIGKKRRIVDPVVIRDILDNSHQLAADLNLGVFCYARTQNTIMLTPEAIPFRLTAPISCTYGLRGPSRHRKFYTGTVGKEDFDYTMQVLKSDRIMVCDARWYFDHGRIFSGRGGNVGLVSDDVRKRTIEELHKRWGRYISTSSPGFAKNRTVDSMSVRVSRANAASAEF